VLGAASIYQLIVVAHELALTSQARSEPHAHQIQQIRKWLEGQAFGPQEIDFVALAGIYHMDYSTLRRRFKQATGYSLKEYVLRIRLLRAKELLAFTRQRIS
jgi:transcriptional regulator GlxA family with amidase domain